MTTYRKGTKCPFCLRWIKYEQVKGSEYLRKSAPMPPLFQAVDKQESYESTMSAVTILPKGDSKHDQFQSRD